MKIERYDEDFDVGRAFPKARLIHLAEGTSVYSAERDDVHFLIIDSRTMLDMLGPEDRQDLSSEIVAVYSFRTEVERSEYLQNRRISPNEQA